MAAGAKVTPSWVTHGLSSDPLALFSPSPLCPNENNVVIGLICAWAAELLVCRLGGAFYIAPTLVHVSVITLRTCAIWAWKKLYIFSAEMHWQFSYLSGKQELHFNHFRQMYCWHTTTKNIWIWWGDATGRH